MNLSVLCALVDRPDDDDDDDVDFDSNDSDNDEDRGGDLCEIEGWMRFRRADPAKGRTVAEIMYITVSIDGGAMYDH